MKKIFNGIEIMIEEDGTKSCEFKDYIEVRNRQKRSWSEESFCNWCDKHGIAAIG